MSKQSQNKNICNYIYELGALKKFRHSGPKLMGVMQPDSIAEHAFRASIIGYILAEMEGVNPEKTALICLFHDNAEARISDLHKVARRYLDNEEAEMSAYKEQTAPLPSPMGSFFLKTFKEYEERKTKESIIARDADLLETAFQSKEYTQIGYHACQDIVDNVKTCLQTKSAKALFKEMETTKFSDWWKGLKKLPKY